MNQSRLTCEVVHIGIVCAGYNSSRLASTLLKSVLFYRTNPIHFHFMVDTKADLILRHLLETWNLPEVNFTFYQAEKHIPFIEWIPNKHYSGVYGLLKLLFPQILFGSVSRIITLDTDVTVLSNILELWKEFQHFTEKQAIGLVENQSEWYFGKLWSNYKPWPAFQRGFNTGVMLLDINKLNVQNWTSLWKRQTAKNLVVFGTTSLADQDIINAVIKSKPEILYNLPCLWNVQLGDNTLSSNCYGNINEIKAIHWNSPRKFDVKNKFISEFLVLYQTFVEYNGNFLRAAMFKCYHREAERPVEEIINCKEFRKANTIQWRTHLYIFDYLQEDKVESFDLALVTQLSIDRLQMVEEIAKHWEGPITFTIYLTDAEVQFLINYIVNSNVLKIRRNIAYHAVFKDGDIYPVNFLRNIGIEYTNTPYVFLSDIDFIPMYNLYSKAKKHIQDLSLLNKKKALLVPAFESQRYRSTFPRSKAQLLYMLDHSMLYTFRFHVWTKGHKITNYSKWRTATFPYTVEWKPDFEPYVIVPKTVPLYDARFVGFGWNKVSHIMELYAQNYEFVVLPDVFIIHFPHTPSYDISKFRASSTYRLCLKQLKEEFIMDLNKKYSIGNSSIIKNFISD